MDTQDSLMRAALLTAAIKKAVEDCPDLAEKVVVDSQDTYWACLASLARLKNMETAILLTLAKDTNLKEGEAVKVASTVNTATHIGLLTNGTITPEDFSKIYGSVYTEHLQALLDKEKNPASRQAYDQFKILEGYFNKRGDPKDLDNLMNFLKQQPKS